MYNERRLGEPPQGQLDDFDFSSDRLKMELSPDQKDVLEKLLAFNGEVMRAFGYAGTGKTTIIRELAKRRHVKVATYMGKATQVLRDKGVKAVTIYSMIYRSVEQSRDELDELIERLEKTTATKQRKRLEQRILELKIYLRNPKFELNPNAFEDDWPDLIVIDECSMVNEQIAEDLLSFGIPLAVFGDPGQLPPIDGVGYFMQQKPDVMLTEIHRQAKDNPIIQMATAVREGRGLSIGSYGKSSVTNVMPHDDAVWELHKRGQDEQLIVGRTKIKDAYNKKARRAYKFVGDFPNVNKSLICLRNNHEIGLLNGSQWVVQEVEDNDDNVLHLVLRDEHGDRTITCDAWKDVFTLGENEFKNSMSYRERCEAEEFDYAYAITCHRAQGSEWLKVFVLDELPLWKRDGNNEHLKWLYTAITRAQEKVTILRLEDDEEEWEESKNGHPYINIHGFNIVVYRPEKRRLWQYRIENRYTGKRRFSPSAYETETEAKDEALGMLRRMKDKA